MVVASARSLASSSLVPPGNRRPAHVRLDHDVAVVVLPRRDTRLWLIVFVLGALGMLLQTIDFAGDERWFGAALLGLGTTASSLEALRSGQAIRG